MSAAVALLAVLGALCGARADFDYRDIAFWTRVHSIPATYHVAQAQVEIPEDKRDQLRRWLSEAGGTRPSVAAGYAHSELWSLPRERLAELPAAVERVGRMVSYKEWPADPRSTDDLPYKRDHLKLDQEQLGSALDAMPSIRGLVRAQLSYVETLIDVDARADATADLRIVFVDSGSNEPPPSGRFTRFAPIGSGLPPSASPSDDGFWNRSTNDVQCGGSLALIKASVRVPRGTRDAAGSAVREFQRGHSVPSLHCAVSYDHDLIFIRLAEEPTLRRMLSRFGSLSSWRRLDPSEDAWNMHRGARKHELLSRDFAAHGAELARTPHIETLVRAELARLEPAQDDSASLKGAALVRLTWETDP